MSQIPVVCLCQQYDLKGHFGPGFAAAAPEIELLRPDEVTDPAAISHALAFRPGPEDFAPYPALRLVASAGAGVDGLLANPGLPASAALTRMVNPEQARMMAAFALHYITGWHRRIWEYPPLQAEERWEIRDLTPPSRFPVGLLGYGNMGRALGPVLVALGFPVLALGSTPREEDGVRVVAGDAGLTEIAETARALVNLLPLTPETQGILSAPFFSKMRKHAMLIQIGRGGHLVEADLLAGLAEGRPARALLDVTDPEPLPPGHPFWQHPQIMITPHVASEVAPEDLARAIAAAVHAVEAGETPPGLVDRSRGY